VRPAVPKGGENSAKTARGESGLHPANLASNVSANDELALTSGTNFGDAAGTNSVSGQTDSGTNWTDALLGGAVQVPGKAKLNVTYVKTNAYLRWRWTDIGTNRRVVRHIGALAPKREGTKRISDEERNQFEQRRNGRRGTNKRRR
jgi:hypothetical protein